MNEEILQHLSFVKETGEEICRVVQHEIDKLGFRKPIMGPSLDNATFQLSADPMNGKNTLVGMWRNDRGEKCGQILFHADGTFYAEYDVVRVHPSRANWFVESISAWGNNTVVKAEPNLLPAVG